MNKMVNLVNFNSYFKKLIIKINQKVSDFQKVAAETAVNNLLKKDAFYFFWENKKQIELLFPDYLDKYRLICVYLQDDFGILTTKFNNEKTILEDEINLHEKVEKILNSKIDRRTKMLDKFKINKNIKKWYILSAILENYEDALLLLKKKAQNDKYKLINIDEELVFYEINKKYIQDFSDLGKDL
jgi:hypothetical protein